IAGPMGAFMALPVAALIVAVMSSYAATHEVVYRSPYAETVSDEETAEMILAEDPRDDPAS
ncbi:MAG: hypothetical protein KDB69_02320, partial [Acidimicrobiia bacterium]|nr:hypothetical protein [Acidimicrobiia bacterium]